MSVKVVHYSNRFITFYVSKFIYFHSFGCLEGRFELKIRCRKQPWEMVGPSRARCAEKYGNMMARGCIWEYFEALWSCGGSP